MILGSDFFLDVCSLNRREGLADKKTRMIQGKEFYFYLEVYIYTNYYILDAGKYAGFTL